MKRKNYGKLFHNFLPRTENKIMGIIDDYWDKRNKEEVEGNPVSALAEALFELMKGAYIGGWIDRGTEDEIQKKKSEEKDNE